MGGGSFLGSGLCRLSLPVALGCLDPWALQATPMETLDLSMCADLSGLGVPSWCLLEVRELRLPGRDFAGLTRSLMPGSRVEVLQADIDAVQARDLTENLEKWGIDRLRIVSSKLATPIDWGGGPVPQPKSVTGPEKLATPSAVFLTRWRDFEMGELNFLRSIDMSALTLTEFPGRATLSRCFFIEDAILPTGLRVLPVYFFRWCCRLSRVDTSGCTVLEEICMGAFMGCRSLAKFDFPRTVRQVRWGAFGGTAIVEADLSETVAESATFSDMIFLERLTLPRRCATQLSGLPHLRHLAVGPCSEVDWMGFGRPMHELRFESFHAPPGKAAGLQNARRYAEVAAAFALESIPSIPA